jgi:hypothetical protein
MRTTQGGASRLRHGLLRIAIAILTATAACSSSEDPARLPSSAQYAGRCVAPRAGIDPSTGAPYLDRQGTLADEKAWLRSWIDELYLWYREVPNADPAPYSTAESYFDVLKTPAVTASGAPEGSVPLLLPDRCLGGPLPVRRGGGVRRPVDDPGAISAAPDRGRIRGAGLAGSGGGPRRCPPPVRS